MNRQGTFAASTGRTDKPPFASHITNSPIGGCNDIPFVVVTNSFDITTKTLLIRESVAPTIYVKGLACIQSTLKVHSNIQFWTLCFESDVLGNISEVLNGASYGVYYKD